MSAWIDVNQVLPKGECIAYGYQGEMIIGYVSSVEFEDYLYSCETDGFLLTHVTHWMPLPDPPQQTLR